MKIERLKPPARGGGKVSVCFDDGTTLRVPSTVAADFGLCPGRVLEDSDLAALETAAGETSAKERAVRIISTASVSKADLERRLTQKGETPENAKQAVAWLDELSLLDDERLAQQLVARGAAKGYGKSRVRQLLYEKGIPRELWEDALEQMPAMEQYIDKFLSQRFGGRQPERGEIKKAADALARRGHSWQDIQAGLRRYREDLAQWEEMD